MAEKQYIYQCKKCGLVVNSTSPSSPSGTCPQGPGSNHSWTKTTV